VRTNVRRVGQVAWVGSYARVAPRRALAMDTSCVGARRTRVPGRLADAVRGSRTPDRGRVVRTPIASGAPESYRGTVTEY
jgi:hypothetical protein